MLTYDELEALVVDTGDKWALPRALAPLDEKARAKLSAPMQKLYRQLQATKVDATASERLKAVLAARDSGTWTYWNSAERRHATLGLFALCPVSVVKKRQIFIWEYQLPLLDRIIRDRRPAWLDEWIAHDLESGSTYLDFATLRGWIRDEVCAKPEVDRYYRMFAGYLMRPGHPRKKEVIPPITAQLLADPALLADVEGLFRVETGAFDANTWLQANAAPDYESWTDALLTLSADGHLDRARLLRSALDGLTRDFKQTQLSGFHRFYRQMAPTEVELLAHQRDYIDLLCHPVGHVVKFAIDMLAGLAKKDALDAASALRELPLVFSGDGKGNALAALKLLKHIITRHTQNAREALIVVGEALRHAHPDVQSSALDILDAHHAQITQEILAQLREMAPFIAASNRSRFAHLLAGPDQDQGRETAGAPPPSAASTAITPSLAYRPIADDGIEPPILRPEDAIAPIETVDALINAVLHAAEVVDSPDEIERIIDGISRLATARPADFDARVAPLLHRLETGGGSNSIILGTMGVGGALLDLIYTWLTGQLYRTPSEEPAYFTSEDGFVPVRAHLRAIAGHIHRGDARPLLSAPTHKGGWIDPLAWVERLRQTHDDAIADSMDFRLSMLRLAPDHRAEARAQAAALPAPLRRIVDFALGGDARPAQADRARYAAWITAARCRDPYRDWSAELAPLNLDDQYPDGVRPARYIWRSSHTPHHYDNIRTKLPELTLSVTCESGDVAVKGAGGMLDRITSAFRIQRATDWSSLPTAALNRRMDAKPRLFGDFNRPWVTQWLSFIWPQNPAAACMRGVTRLMLRTDDSSSSWSPSHGFLQSLFQRGRPWREPGHLLLCVGLVGKDADARGLAIDALIEGIDARLFDPDVFAATIARLAEGAWIKYNRLGDALMPVVHVSPLHAHAVSEALQRWLPNLELTQKNAFRLLEVLVEAQALTNEPIKADIRTLLKGLTGSSKAAKIAKQLARDSAP